MNAPIFSQVASDFNAQAASNGWATFCDASLAFRRPELRDAAALWEKMKAGRPMPARRELTPRVLKNYLAHVSLYERLQDGGRRRYRFRLQGSAYEPVLGDLTGQLVDEAVPPGQVAQCEATFDTAIAYGGPLRFLARSAVLGKSFLVGEFLVAPLADVDGAPNFVLGIAYYEGACWDDVAASFRKSERLRAIRA